MIYRNVLQTIQNYKMLDGVKSVLLGFSGGADSTALLHCLSMIPDIKLYAVHINHGIRGDEALRDQSFCEDVCIRYGIKFFSVNIDVPAISELSGMSIEETARVQRYRIFNELCLSENIDRIATAHNSGDNTETVIFNLTRGTSLRGLCGIPPVRDNIIRPLIECSKADIIAYCEQNNLQYVTDSTNNDNIYTRNFIRSEIVPELKTLNPSVDSALTRMCRSLRSDEDYFNAEVSKLPDKMTAEQLAALHDSILSRWIIRRYETLNPDGFLGYGHIRMIIGMIRAGYPQKINLPGGVDFVTPDFVKNIRNDKKSIPETRLVYGENPVGGTNFTVFLTDNEKDIKLLKNIYKLFIYKVFNFDKIIGYIYMRSRRNGDKYVFGGMTRNVKKLLCDRRIPTYERDSVPFICDDNGILWIPGFDIRDSVKINDDCRKRVYIAYCGLLGADYEDS